MASPDWQKPGLRCFGLLLTEGEAALLLLFNAADIPARFVLPDPPGSGAWHLLLDTAQPDKPLSEIADSLPLAARSLALLELRAEPFKAR